MRTRACVARAVLPNSKVSPRKKFYVCVSHFFLIFCKRFCIHRISLFMCVVCLCVVWRGCSVWSLFFSVLLLLLLLVLLVLHRSSCCCCVDEFGCQVSQVPPPGHLVLLQWSSCPDIGRGGAERDVLGLHWHGGDGHVAHGGGQAGFERRGRPPLGGGGAWARHSQAPKSDPLPGGEG